MSAATDGALLALIIDDTHAIQVLAAWAALEPQLADLEAVATVCVISELCGVPRERAIASLKKLRAARVLTDGGITELADRMLQSHVQSRLVSTPKRKR